MKIEINASKASTAKHHMEAVWNAITLGKPAETYRFQNYSVKVEKTEHGYVSAEFERI